MKKNLFVFSVLLLVCFYSCKNNDVFLQNESGQSVFVKDGILHVKDTSTLFKIIKNNLSKNIVDIREWQDSLQFNSYQVFYDDVFNEYEDIVLGMPDNNNKMLRFINDYSAYLSFSEKYIDGVRDYSFYPKVNPIYLSVANVEGKLIVGNSFYDTSFDNRNNQTNLKSIEGFYYCSKSTRKRNMTVHLFTKFPPYPIYSFQYVWVWHQKKFLWGWVSYRTRYYWRYHAGGYVYENHSDIPSGTQFSIWNDARYLEIWNRGVGESNKCVFSW